MSSEIKIFFTGGVENGVLKISDRKSFDRDITVFNGKRIQGYVTRAKKTRSVKQNSALWGIAYVYAAEGFREMGNLGFTPEDAHEYFKQEFKPSYKEVINTKTGETIKIVTTTTASTTQMKDYYLQIQIFCAENFGIVVPDPDPLFALEESH